MSLYEIHINLEWENLFHNIEYCKEHELKYIYLFTPSAKTKQHFIVTKWKHGTEKEAIERAQKLADDMTSEGLKVTRIKVEGLLSDYADSSSYLYAEFHIRVPSKSVFEYTKLREICVECHAEISYVANKEQNPYITLQFKSSGPDLSGLVPTFKNIPKYRALELKSKFIEMLKLAGFSTTGKMHSEAVLFDTNPDLDL